MKFEKFLLLLIFSSPYLLRGQSQLEKSTVDSLVQQAVQFRQLYEFENALAEAQKASAEAIEFAYAKGQADSYVQIGRAHKGLRHYDAALAAYKKAYDIRLFSLADSCAAAKVRNNMVSVLNDKFDYAGGKNNLIQALAYAQEAENLIFNNPACLRSLARGYVNRANVYESLDSIELAITYNKRGLSFFNLTRDTAAHIYGLYGLAKRLISIERLDSARHHLNLALALLDQYSKTDEFLQGQLNEALGVVELNSNRPEEALKYFHIAKEFYKQFPMEILALTHLNYNIAQTYDLQGEFIEAKKAYGNALLNEAKQSTKSPMYQILEALEKLMDSKEEKKKEEKKVFYALISLIILSTTLLITIAWLFLKERKINKLKEQHYQLKHDIVKNGLRTIDNHITADLPALTKNQAAYSSILRIRGMTKRILSQIGYGDDQSLSPTKLKPFVQDMHQRAQETSLMDVQNYSYLDEIEDYQLSENLRFNLEAIITEAFSNVQKYADCKTSSINFTVDENGLTILIQDDGKGCDLGSVNRSGLNTISQRVKTINGNVFFNSAPGKGFSIKINVPRFPEVL